VCRGQTAAESRVACTGLRVPPNRNDALVHELSIALSLVDAVCEELPRLGSRVAVRSVRIRVGPLSGVVADALAFAFDVAAGDSPIAGARLDIERTMGNELELTALEITDEPEDR
jgi:Zn finger protein HypA/HybF involved in hydrogenase expression